MIYMDNGATSYPKPRQVVNAIEEACAQVGNPGRGIHPLAVWSSLKIAEARSKIAELFNISDPLRVAFTMNATHSLNIAVNLCRGHIVTTSMDHNSVLRPVYARKYYTIVGAHRDGHIAPQNIIKAISDNTGAVIMTHASNVTGEIYDIEAVGAYCRKKKILFIVDCAQSAGAVPIDVKKMNIDCLCFTGHKGLFGLQGTGGIYVAPHVPIRPYMLGGTGTQSYSLAPPMQMPECFEAGTLNTHGIATLCAGVDYLNEIGVEKLHKAEMKLRKYFVDKLSSSSKITVYGPLDAEYTGVISVNVAGMEPKEVGVLMAEKGICCRTGYHCAPLAHKSLGTVPAGTVRFSLNHMNTLEEIDTVAGLLLSI